ncbi:BglG family transcription antiterminator [Sebaldella termitidis]|uniref:BglG family transcription antiterminator n=1 Tax=Sebaldella termitidis TaxID=826 RepID=UPI003EBF64C1
MFLDRNDILILKEFLHKNNMQLKELIGLLNLKERSIKYKIDNINYVLSESGYDIKLKFEHYNLMLTDKEKKLSQFLRNFKIENYSFNKSERVEVLEFAYLFTLKAYKAEELEGVLNMGRSALKSDLYELKKSFARENLSFSSTPKLGLSVKGSENTIRRLMIERILKYFYVKDFNKLLLKDDTCMISRAVEFFAKNILSYDIKKIFDMLKLLEKKMNKVMSEEGFRVLLIYVLVSSFRTGKFPLAAEDVSNESFLKSAGEYKMINEAVKEAGETAFNEYEILKFTEYLLGTYSYNFEYSFYDNWVKMETLAKEMIKNIEEETGILVTNKKFEEEVIRYLRPAIYRIKNDIQNTAVDYKKVMERYNFLYKATEKSLKSLEEFLGKKIDANEIAYLTVYLRMAVENYRKNEKRETDKNIVVVCKYGYGTSQLIKGRLDYIYRVKDIKVLPYEEYLSYNLDNIQLIISSLNLEKSDRNIPIIKVSPLLDDNDIKKLDFYLERKIPRKIEVKKIMEIINKYTSLESNPEMLKELAEYCNDISYENNSAVMELLPEENFTAE